MAENPRQEDELVIALSPAQAGAVVAFVVALFLIVRALRGRRSD
ncbi:MAG TPA: hypothetical protein VEB69_12385 [Acidimicrobiia bacterium]|nr:hypothetical protein [Acidimicrobiia bacterium]